MKNTALFLIVVAVTIASWNPVSAFICFKCNSNEYELCESEPNELPATSTTECEGFCTIVRTEYTDIPGEAVTLVRDCEIKPTVPSGVRTDKHYTKMYTSCNTDRCNSGDGKRDAGEGENGNTGPKNIITVFESNSGVMNNPSAIFLILTMCLYITFAAQINY